MSLINQIAPVLEIYLANPRGFCAGVERAVKIVELALKKYGAPIYVRHEIVHNKYVVEQLQDAGAIFVEEVDEIPNGAVAIFSAHGVSKKVEDRAKFLDLHVIDATCPLVTKVHLQAQKFEREGSKIVLIGHAKHPEIEGTSGRVKQEVFIVSDVDDVEKIPFSRSDNIAYVTQTTLSLDDTKNIIEQLKTKYPKVKGPELNNICFATQNRQEAVKNLAKIVDTIFVIGAKNSSNSNRLRDIAESCGVQAYLLNDESEVDHNILKNTNRLGITAGASAPEILVGNLIQKIAQSRRIEVKNVDGIIETVKFKIPNLLKDADV
ncbi:4-hydroxy-3-methylbut-2-enyl diphosphate reductase [Candidatus Bandiella euplotis]|uniref:4-hydroxy-3-methylbut-2-enyl diphosphate reductase n=1 Tax=Candidatus Bandiella euplotis TaxID=1664265 RepID=A0ABZ0UM12_9RICK|nr:4-hydroxy-3-methylbut-2-enyl diphosphate reductase [Candidatus Bandiella woodruffii]WPX97166.1 4-hydroxy-3-methylbut-2-enyl diphosphate reductase [Candidatus Bandiella woodruffii]